MQLKRCKPLLGTFVTIAVEAPAGTDRSLLIAQSEAGFREITRIEALLSAHLSSSDLTRFNVSPLGEWVEYSSDFVSIMLVCDRLHALSGGVFDPTVGSELASCGLIPQFEHVADNQSEAGRWNAVEVDRRGNRARRLARVHVDLGGIGKGYSVDCAVAALQRAGCQGGIVNAGGDLRTFGKGSHFITIRSGADLAGVTRRITLEGHGRNGSAIASSGGYFFVNDISATVNPATKERVRCANTVSVVGRRCTLVDALTKVASIDPNVARRLANRFRAKIFVTGPELHDVNAAAQSSRA